MSTRRCCPPDRAATSACARSARPDVGHRRATTARSSRDAGRHHGRCGRRPDRDDLGHRGAAPTPTACGAAGRSRAGALGEALVGGCRTARRRRPAARSGRGCRARASTCPTRWARGPPRPRPADSSRSTPETTGAVAVAEGRAVQADQGAVPWSLMGTPVRRAGSRGSTASPRGSPCPREALVMPSSGSSTATFAPASRATVSASAG